MANIILFKGGVETQEYFSRQMAKTFKKLGYDVFFFDLQDMFESFLKLTWFCGDKDNYMVTFNFNGIAGEEVFFDENGQSFWNKRNILCINIVVDHPFYYHDYILNVPNRYIHISIDRNHRKYMKRFFPDINSDIFMPLAGTKIYEEYFPIKDRSMDIVFTGNFTPTSTFEKYINRIDEDYTQFYYSIIDELIKYPDSVLEKVIEKHVHKDIGAVSETDLRDCMKNMIFIDLYVRFYVRGKAVKTLAENGFKVHTCGQGWNLLECKNHENIIEGGGLTSFGCLQKISDSKISLNVMPWFKDGAHDRIYNSQLNGALSLSDDSIFLRETLQNDINVEFFSIKELEKLPQIAERLLSDNDLMQNIADEGYNNAKENNTWEKRAMLINSIIKSQ